MNRTIQDVIPSIKQYFSTQPITRAWLLAPNSQNKAILDSDVVIFVQYVDSDAISLFDISRMTLCLQQILGKPVNLIESNNSQLFAKDNANPGQILIYEKVG